MVGVANLGREPQPVLGGTGGRPVFGVRGLTFGALKG